MTTSDWTQVAPFLVAGTLCLLVGIGIIWAGVWVFLRARRAPVRGRIFVFRRRWSPAERWCLLIALTAMGLGWVLVGLGWFVYPPYVPGQHDTVLRHAPLLYQVLWGVGLFFMIGSIVLVIPWWEASEAQEKRLRSQNSVDS